MIITIDGPAASGKSTMARLLAKRLGFFYLNTGLLYRALAYLLVNTYHYDESHLFNPALEDVQKALDQQHFSYTMNASQTGSIVVDGKDITSLLKTPLIDQYASIIGTSKVVRDQMAYLQRAMATAYNIIVEGRDAGSVVFPQAEVKFFLTAQPKIRAQRWYDEKIKNKNNTLSLKQALHEILERDKRDSERSIAPLIIPEGAHVIDNSTMNIEQTLEAMLNIVNTHKANNDY